MAELDVTGFPYVRDEYPARDRKPLSEFINIGTYTPPRDWGALNRNHKQWMGSMPPMIHKLVRDSPTKSLNIMTQIICVKNWAREQGVITNAGVIAWVNFSSIDPCYVALDDQESYFMVTKAEYEADE